MKRVEQKEKRRQEILDAGLDLFIRQGYAATRTAEIAKSVGMSEGLLFHYFETKEKLYFALIDIALAGRENSFQIGNFDPVTFFEKTAEYVIDNCVNDPFAAKLFVLMNHAQNNHSLPTEIREKITGQKELEETVKIIKQGQEEGNIKDGDPIALALAFWMAIHGIVENMAKNPELPVPKSVWIVDIIKR